MKKHLITGITGQDGLFLVKRIIEAEPRSKVIGISRSLETSLFYKNLNSLGVKDNSNIKIHNLNLNNASVTEEFLKDLKPDSVYNLTGPSSPYESIQNPNKYNQVENIFNNLTAAFIKNRNFPNFFQASSSEMFKNNNNSKLSEDSIFDPISPYANYKLKNHNNVLELREEYNWNIYSGIMFNHESEFRKEQYLFKKIINSARLIKAGKQSELVVGSLDYVRDWSFAGDISSGIYLITNNGKSGSYVMGSGVENNIGYLISIVFQHFKLDVNDFVSTDSSLLRKGDPDYIVSNPSKIREELGWKTSLNFEDLVYRCISL